MEAVFILPRDSGEERRATARLSSPSAERVGGSVVEGGGGDAEYRRG
jgi:hypothetical protein